MDKPIEFATPQDPAPQPPPGGFPNPYMPPAATAEAPPEPTSGFPNPFAPAPPQGESSLQPPTLAPLEPMPPDLSPPVSIGQEPAPTMQVAAPAQPTVAPGYHWCPNCFLASSTPGNCVSCASPLQPVTTHLPYGPFRPMAVGPSKGRIFTRILSALMLPIVGLVAFWLYQSGSPAGATADANDGLVHTAAHTMVHLPELGSANLPGRWAADPILKDNLQSSLNSDGGKGTALLAERSGQTIIWMATIVKSPGENSSSSKCTNTPLGNGTVTLAGKQAESADYKSVCPDGTSYSRTYQMQDADATLILKVVSQVSPTSFRSIEAAFLALPGSSSGSVGL